MRNAGAGDIPELPTLSPPSAPSLSKLTPLEPRGTPRAGAEGCILSALETPASYLKREGNGGGKRRSGKGGVSALGRRPSEHGNAREGCVRGEGLVGRDGTG